MKIAQYKAGMFFCPCCNAMLGKALNGGEAHRIEVKCKRCKSYIILET